MESINGYVERVTYYNEETGFMVAKLQEKGKKELTTVVGSVAGVSPGESLILHGRWVHDQKYGEQFRIEQYEALAPVTLKGIEKYLGSGLIRGIGPVMARRIVDAFGAETLDVIENRPDRLSCVEGIGQKRIEMIAEAWEELKEVKEIMVFLQGHGVGAAYASRIYRQYGAQATAVVRENPYRLAAEVHGIGFITADRLARNMGLDLDSPMRVQEGLIYVLHSLTEEGHVYYPYEQLIDRAASLLDVDRELVSRAAVTLAASSRIVIEELNGRGLPSGRAVYLAPFYAAETGLARLLVALQEEQPPLRPFDIQKALDWIEGRLGIELAERQKEAISLAARHKLLVITGGPGTGKTTIIRAIIQIYKALQLRVVLTAPTGRAAKRMQEATGYEACTIHRLLEYSVQKGRFNRDRDNPLPADAVIVDEASMIDTLLMYNLAKAIPPHALLIIVGDTDQLPSVGPGNVLKDIITSGRFRVVTLNEIFRQSRQSRIIVNAHRINRGEFPETRRSPEGSDFYFIDEDDPEQVLARILELCRQGLRRRFGLHALTDCQVLTPMHKGIIGVANLNDRLQKALNPAGPAVTRGSRSYRVRDKVMQIVNNYDKEVFNGDIGWIQTIDIDEQQLAVNFDGRIVEYAFNELDELVHAYAISVHKSQGSEYPAIIMPVMTQHYLLLQRNLIYTAVTRGKKLVILIGTKKALAMAIKNNKTQQRYTRLSERLAELV